MSLPPPPSLPQHPNNKLGCVPVCVCVCAHGTRAFHAHTHTHKQRSDGTCAAAVLMWHSTFPAATSPSYITRGHCCGARLSAWCGAAHLVRGASGAWRAVRGVWGAWCMPTVHTHTCTYNTPCSASFKQVLRPRLPPCHRRHPHQHPHPQQPPPLRRRRPGPPWPCPCCRPCPCASSSCGRPCWG